MPSAEAALLGLQGGESCERGEGEPDWLSPAVGLSDYLRLNPVRKVVDWRIGPQGLE